MSSTMQDFLTILVDFGYWNKTPYHKLMIQKKLYLTVSKSGMPLRHQQILCLVCTCFLVTKNTILVSSHVGKKYNRSSLQNILLGHKSQSPGLYPDYLTTSSKEYFLRPSHQELGFQQRIEATETFNKYQAKAPEEMVFRDGHLFILITTFIFTFISNKESTYNYIETQS